MADDQRFTNNFTVLKNDTVGRYGVSSKDLKPGDVIFEEEPFVYGPKFEQPPMCLGCYVPVDCLTLCNKCSWPVCSVACEEVTAHKEAECKVFKEAGVKFQHMPDPTQICFQFECITPLRTLLAIESDKSRWDTEINCMSAHLDKRRSLPIWKYVQVNIVEYLRGPCKLNRFSEDLIHQVCGILDVNAFEAYTLQGDSSIRCLYPKLAILSHNCVSNTTHTICNGPNSNYKMILRSTTHIKNGAELFSSYVYSMLPTLIRRSALKASKYFDCTCDRCKDPTELGSHMGTLKCSKCDNGVILSTAPLEDEAVWKCTHCEFATRSTAVQRVFETIQSEIDSVDVNVESACQALEARESIYRKYKSVLHPRNSFHTILRLALAQMYGKVEGYELDALPDLLLERKVELCQQVLENLNVIEPGYTRTRAIVLYEMHAPLILLARNSFRSGAIDKDQVREKLLQAMNYLEEAQLILQLEPLDSKEGQLAVAAAGALAQLNANIDELVNVEF